jgi:adenylate cyclase
VSARDQQAAPASPLAALVALAGRVPVRLALGLGLLIAVSVAVVGGFRVNSALRNMEAGLNDSLRVVLTPYSQAQDPRISILTITEDTLARFPYRSPVDRDFLAGLVDRLNRAGALAVGIDILFDQATEPGKDDRLVAALAAFEGPAVVAWANARQGLRPAQEAFLGDFIDRSGAEPGFAALIYDSDGVVRRFGTALPDTDVRSFPAHMLQSAGGAVTIPDGLIDWRRETADGKTAFQTLPGHAILNPALPEALFRGWFGGRYVLIGADLEQTDRHQTSLAADPTLVNRTQPGVLLHAHVLSQMLDGRQVRDFNVGGAPGAVLTVLMALVGALLGLRGGALALKLALLALAVGAWLGLAGGLASLHGPYLPIAPPLLALGLAFGLGGVAEAFVSAREKAFIRQAFSHYLEPAMVDRLAKDRTSLRLGGERRELSFIFTDIEGFTEMTERLEPEVLTTLLNDYFDGMSDIIAANHGMIDKFIGDAVVALFGAPTADPSHALNAVRAAEAMDAFTQAFRASHGGLGLGVTRIGVHTGIASVGNFGGRRRFDFTAMGDAMNTAARLESINKALGTRVTVSGAARTAAMADANRTGARLPAMRPAGRLALKGKAGATEAWNLTRDADPAMLAGYDAAFNLLCAEDAAAEPAFAALAARWPDDPLIALHLRRLRAGGSGETVAAA